VLIHDADESEGWAKQGFCAENLLQESMFSMALEWNSVIDKYVAMCSTRFAVLRVYVDMEHTKTTDHTRYEARVEDIIGAELASADDLPSIEAACAWCEQCYAALLRAALARIDG
jgi:hypothetical protein